MSYVDDRYFAPDGYDTSNAVICTFKVKTTEDFGKVSKEIAAESSVGTWTMVHTLTDDIFDRLAARVLEMQPEQGIVKIAYPYDIFEQGSLPQMLSLVVGNILGMKSTDAIRLIDIDIPASIREPYPGPAFGIEGFKNALKITKDNDRPIIGTIIKPKMGLPPDRHAQVAYEAWYGGIDFVKDDEPQTDQTFCGFEDRISKVLEKADLVKEETGRNVVYAANITAPLPEMEKRAEYVKDQGGNCMMIDVLTTGFAAVQYMRSLDLGLLIHAHRAMHAAMTRHPDHGIHMVAFAKWLRLAGVDSLHAGTVVGKMEGGYHDVKVVYDALRDTTWKQKPALPVASGGLYPGSIYPITDMFGFDVLINAGGGVHGHPGGTVAGAKAMRQAVDAVVQKRDLWEFAEAENHKELLVSLEQWGVPRKDLSS